MRAALQPRPRMPDDALDALAVQARTDKAARESVVLECMGLIIERSKRARNTLGADAFGDASVALLEAIDSFEPEQGDFRTWAVYIMTCRLADASRTEKRFRARIMRGDETLAPSDSQPMPELLSRAVASGTLTERQAQMVQAKAAGATRQEVMERFGIHKTVYHEEMRAALAALKSYL